MQSGVFAILDCLGFKGIWNSYRDVLLSKLRHVNEHAQNIATSKICSDYRDIVQCKVRLLSDSISISLTSPFEGSAKEAVELLIMAHVCTGIVNLYLFGEPHLLLRGCICYGEHVIEENFLVGPAVDLAAEYMDTAQGAFIWLLPPATKIIDVFLDKNDRPPNIVAIHESACPYYNVPMKNGSSIYTRVVNPFDLVTDPDDIISGFDSVLSSKNNLDVWQKRQNTIQYLFHCKNVKIKYDSLLQV